MRLGDRPWAWFGLVAGVLGTAPFFFQNTVQPFRNRYFDILKKSSPAQPIDGEGSPIAVVAIDGGTLAEFGQVIPRRIEAEAIERIAAAHPRLIALDIDFSERDPVGVEVEGALESLKHRLPTGVAPLLEETRARHDPDARLLQALGGVAVASIFYAAPSGALPYKAVEGQAIPPSWRLDAVACANLPSQEMASIPEHRFQGALAGAGNAWINSDPDGVARRYPLLTRLGPKDCQGCVYPSFALVAAERYLGVDEVYLDCNVGGGDVEVIDLVRNDGSLTERVPVDGEGKLEIPFHGPLQGTLRQPLLSLQKVLAPGFEHSPDQERLRDRQVFVGEVSQYSDYFISPAGDRFAGVAIHALMANELIGRHWLKRGARIAVMEAVATLGVGILVTLLFLYLDLGNAELALCLLFPVAGHLLSGALYARGWLVDAFTPGLVGALAVLLCSVGRYYVERERAEAEKERAERLRGFLSPAVAEIAARKPELLLPAKREITILFSDIRGFTTTAEGMPPEALVSLLDGYLTRMTQIVFDHHGTLDKYIGDAVMALFGAPVDLPGHAAAGCRAALAMLAALKEMQAQWKAKGLPVLEIGIGINTGVVSVGRLGSAAKSEYTCIGDEVNFASRVEGLTKAYGAAVLVGDTTRSQAGDAFLFRDLGPVRVKGKKKATRVHELLGPREAYPEPPVWLETFAAGLEYFRAGDWEGADRLFQETIAARGGSDPPSASLMQWTQIYRRRPPPEDWDGTIERREK